MNIYIHLVLQEIGEVGINMSNIGKIGLNIGVIGGIGLGLLLGSEYPGRNITLIGAALVLISLVSMCVLSYKSKK